MNVPLSENDVFVHIVDQPWNTNDSFVHVHAEFHHDKEHWPCQ